MILPAKWMPARDRGHHEEYRKGQQRHQQPRHPVAAGQRDHIERIERPIARQHQRNLVAGGGERLVVGGIGADPIQNSPQKSGIIGLTRRNPAG